MKYRKLRIAFSATCGIACVLLVVLWVRSYWWIDAVVQISKTSVCQFSPYEGQLVFGWADDARAISTYMSARGEGLSYDPVRVEAWHEISPPLQGERIIRPFSSKPNEFVVPFWAPVLISAILCATPWLTLRFSLRTLLITTTVVALVLGHIIYATRG